MNGTLSESETPTFVRVGGRMSGCLRLIREPKKTGCETRFFLEEEARCLAAAAWGRA
jgi:hypothetical protein